MTLNRSLLRRAIRLLLKEQQEEEAIQKAHHNWLGAELAETCINCCKQALIDLDLKPESIRLTG